MKILLVGPYFANAGHGAECGIADAIIELGHSLAILDPRVGLLSDEGQRTAWIGEERIAADLVLCPGPGIAEKVYLSKTWDYLKCIKVLWNSEPIRLQNYRDKIAAQKKLFNFFFIFDESEIPLYHDLGIGAVGFLPQAFNPKFYRPLPDTEVLYDFCFIGSIGGKWSNREYFLKRVQKFCLENNKSLCINTIFDAQTVNYVYNMHRVVLNLGLYLPELGRPEDLRARGFTQRIFESIGAGRVCVTHEMEKEHSGFLENKNHVLFFNPENLEDVLSYGLNDANRASMEQKITKIRGNHTYKKRMEIMLDVIKKVF